MKRGNLTFVVDARHIRQLGEELVADRVTALSELIKNSYDADATEVTVEFFDVDTVDGTLILSDDGTGMDLQTVRDSWMRIATLHKERRPASERYRRSRQGRKGIGRFAAESLGNRLLLRSARGGEEIEVEFDWKQSYRAGTDLAKVQNPFSVRQAERGHHGTTLRIEGLHDVWGEPELKRVERAVLLLQPPFGKKRRRADQDPGFVVKLRINDEEAPIERAPLEDFLSAATAVVHGRANARGHGTWRLTSDLLGINDQQIYEQRLNTGAFDFTVYYFIYQREVIGDVGVALARDMGNTYGGVRLYRDGLRILPYGDRGDDWLGLDALYRQRTILPPISNANWFGQVFISRQSNRQLIDTSSREGLISGPAFAELRDFIKGGLIWGALRVAAVRQRKQRAGSRPAALANRNVQTRSEFVSQLIERAELLLGQSGDLNTSTRRVLRELRGDIHEAADQDKAEQSIREQLLGELELLRILASLGTSMAVFSHEVRSVLNTATGLVLDLRRQMNLDDTSRELVDSVDNGLERLAELARFIDAYVSRTRRREKRAQPLTAVTRDLAEAFTPLLKRRGIELSWKVTPAHLRTRPMARSELESVLVNLLTNAVKALDNERIKRKEISIDVRVSGRFAAVRFEDTGIGIHKSIADKIFDPFFTTISGSDPTLGIGTGLGLKIVRDIAEANMGTVAIASPSSSFNTCIEFRVPLAE